MYAKLPGGRQSPAGYIVPVELTGAVVGNYTQVRYTAETEQLIWTAWIRSELLLIDEEVEAADD